MPDKDFKKLRIVSDGTILGTKIFAGDTAIGGITRVGLDINVNDSIANVNLQVLPSMIDIFVERTGIEVSPAVLVDDAIEYDLGSEGISVRVLSATSSRTVQLKLGTESDYRCRWITCKLSDLKDGDTFRMYDGDIEVKDKRGNTEFIAEGEAWQTSEGVGGINIKEEEMSDAIS